MAGGGVRSQGSWHDCKGELVRIVWRAENRRAVVIARLGVDHGIAELQGVGAIAKQSAFDSSLDWRSYSSVTQVPV